MYILLDGLSAAIQTGTDLYRKNSDIDLAVEKKDLPQLLEILNTLGYQIEDKRGILTSNYIDNQGEFHVGGHDINANMKGIEMLGVGVFVYERENENVTTYDYAYDERESTFVVTKNVMPEELFDLTYCKDKIEYRDMQLRCQTKEYIYQLKAKGTREKDKLDANVLREYIGQKEERGIKRIKRLENRIQQYRLVYDKDGNLISSTKMPSTEEKIESFISKIVQQNQGKTNEELKDIVLDNEFVKKVMEQREDIRTIMNQWASTQTEENIVEAARAIAHDYYYNDDDLKNNSWELNDEELSKVKRKNAEIAEKYNKNPDLTDTPEEIDQDVKIL